MLHLWDSNVTGVSLCKRVREDPKPEVKNKTETLYQHRDLQGSRQANILSSLRREDIHRFFLAHQQRLQISELHFDKFSTLSIFSCWKIRFKTEVCSCSTFPVEAMPRTKEVELEDSVDDLNHRAQLKETLISRISRCSTRGVRLL